MPLISVVVPVYKVEAYLCRCVDSILKQSFSDFELILVDDGSPDNCGAICEEYAKKDDRIVVIHQKNGGLSAARNAGIDWAFANSTSEWLTFIDSDDWIHPEYLSRLLEAVINCHVPVSICGHIPTEGEEPIIDPSELEVREWEPEKFYIEHNTEATVAWGKLYRKDCFQTLRYPFGKIHEDEYLTYQILFRFSSVAVISAPLYYYYVNPNGIIQSGKCVFREDLYSALENQIQFFHKHHFSSACRLRVRIYVVKVCDEIKKLSENPGNKKALAILKQKKRRHFLSYSRLLDPEQEKDRWVLLRMYPKNKEIHLFLCAVKRKLRRIFSR